MADEIDVMSNGGLTCASHSAISRLTVSLASARRGHERWPNGERDRILAESFTPGKTVGKLPGIMVWALAEIYDGGSRSAAARIGGVGLQIVRDWVTRFNARGPDGLRDGKVPGPRYPSGEAFNHPQVVARVIPVSALRLKPLTRL